MNTEIQIGLRKAGNKVGTGGGRKRKTLDPRNLCHRARKHNDQHNQQMRAVYERALSLCYKLDRTDVDECPATYDRTAKNWEACMATLCEHKCLVKLGALMLAESKRGQVRCKLYVNRAGLSHLIHS